MLRTYLPRLVAVPRLDFRHHNTRLRNLSPILLLRDGLQLRHFLGWNLSGPHRSYFWHRLDLVNLAWLQSLRSLNNASNCKIPANAAHRRSCPGWPTSRSSLPVNGSKSPDGSTVQSTTLTTVANPDLSAAVQSSYAFSKKYLKAFYNCSSLNSFPQLQFNSYKNSMLWQRGLGFRVWSLGFRV